MANTIQIKHSPNATSPTDMSGSTHDLAKGELAWIDNSSNAGGANGKLFIGDATAAGAVQRHIGGVGTGAVAAAAAAGSLTGTTMASNVVTSSLTTVGTIGSGVWNGTSIGTSYTDAKVTSVVAGDGIDVSGATGDVTVTAETATATNPGMVELATTAETTTGTDADRAVTPDGLKDGYAGSANVTTLGTIGTGTWNGSSIGTSYTAAKVTSIVAGDGIDVSGATGDVTVTAETATASNPGVVELATTGETTTGTDTARAVTPAGVQAAIDALVDSAPGALDTLNELAAAIGDDSSYATTVTNALAAKSPIASPTFTGTVAIPNIANLESAVTANTAKVTNTATNLSKTVSGTGYSINSSDGDNIALSIADTDNWGLMSDEMFDTLAALDALTLSGSNTGDESAASTSASGIVELATTAETTTGTDAARAVTPDGLKDGYLGSANVTTLGTIATGTWNGSSIGTSYTDAKVTSIVAGDGIDISGGTGAVTITGETATDSNPGIVELATNAETITGSATDRALTPANLAAATISGGSF